jgi:hypothetical protein
MRPQLTYRVTPMCSLTSRDLSALAKSAYLKVSLYWMSIIVADQSSRLTVYRVPKLSPLPNSININAYPLYHRLFLHPAHSTWTNALPGTSNTIRAPSPTASECRYTVGRCS